MQQQENIQGRESSIEQDLFKQPTACQLDTEYKNKGIHPAFTNVGIKIINDKILGSTARCLALLSACRSFIKVQNLTKIKVQDYETPPNQLLGRDLEKKLEKNLTYLRNCRPFTDGMDTTVKYIKVYFGKYLLTLITPKIEQSVAKEWLVKNIDQYQSQKIEKAKEYIVKNGLELIKDGDTILTFARSNLVEAVLVEAKKKGIKFNLIIADNPPYEEGKDLATRLSQQDIKCTYTLMNGACYFMKKVDRVFLGCSSMLSNGNVISRAGTAMIACIASNYRVPVHVFTETYKFSDQNILDAFGKNEQTDPTKVTPNDTKDRKYKILNLRYDLTPKDNVDMLVTEIGLLPPTCVPVIIREFIRNTYIGKVLPPEDFQ